MPRALSSVFVSLAMTACSLGLPDSIEDYKGASSQDPLVKTAPATRCQPVTLRDEPWIAVRPRRGACDAATLKSVVECLMVSSMRDGASCRALMNAPDQSCLACVRSSPADAELGPLVEDSGGTYINDYGCYAHWSQNLTIDGCGGRVFSAERCLESQCVACADDDQDACIEAASAGACRVAVEAADSCTAPIDRFCYSENSEVESAILVAQAFCLAGELPKR